MVDLVKKAQQIIHHGEEDLLKTLPIIIKRLLDEDVWIGRKDRHGDKFKNFKQFCQHPLHHGLEIPYKRLEQYCEHDEETSKLLRIKGKLPPNPEGLSQPIGSTNNISRTPRNTKQGTRRDYTMERLERERKDLHQQVLDRELTANAAAIAAGFRVKTITVPLDAERAARTLLKHFDNDQIRIIHNKLEERACMGRSSQRSMTARYTDNGKQS